MAMGVCRESREGFPQAVCRGVRSVDGDLLVTDGMFKGYVARVETDGAVGVGTRSAVFQVAFDGATHRGQLATDLVVTACVEIHFEQKVAFALTDEAVVEHGFLAAGHFGGVGVGFVLLLVAREPGSECGFRLTGSFGHDGMVRLVNLSRAEHVVEAREGLAGAGKDDNAAHGAVQAMDYTEKHFAGFSIFFLDVCLDIVGQGAVAGLVALNNLASGFVDDDDMVVFVKDGHGDSMCKYENERMCK